MSTKVTYSDGTSEILSDSEVDNMAPEIQKSVANLEPIADTQIPSLPITKQPVQDPLLANSDTNGQTTLEPVNGTDKVESAMGDPFANISPGHVLANIKELPQVIRYGTSLVPAAVGGVIGAAQDDNTANEGAKSAYKQGLSNEGIAGAIADPMNYVGGVLPASTVEGGVSKVLGSIPKVGVYVKKLSAPVTGLVSGLGLSAADQQMNNGEVQAIPTIAGGAIGTAGGLLSGLGKYSGNKISEYGKDSKDPLRVIKSPKSADKFDQFDKDINDIDPKGIFEYYAYNLKRNASGMRDISVADRQKLLTLSKEAIAESPTTLYTDPSEVPNSEANAYFQKILDARSDRNKKLMAEILPKKIDISELGNNALGGGLMGGAIGNMFGGIIPTATGAALGYASKVPAVKKVINLGLNKAVPAIGNVINNAGDNPASSSLFKGLYNLGAYGLPTIPSKADTSTWQ